MSFEERIGAALDGALRRAQDAAARAAPDRLESRSEPLIIFSDHHKGARNRADDFLPCEPTYLAALRHYLEGGFRLAVLGDGEELWEERPQRVVRSYANVMAAEGEFQRRGRYERYWGNHDEQWCLRPVLNRCFRDFPGGPPVVRESACFTVADGDEELGTLFLIHGHQGTANSERWARIARLSVRWLWRPVQRLTGISPNTPSRNRERRNRHNRAMYHWASRQEGLLLVTGHTHRPVFGSLSWVDRLEEELGLDVDHLFGRHAGKWLWERLDDLAHRPDWIEAEGRTPCYFNSGCCCYPDGSITGIEIAHGEIRLVRWDALAGAPARRVLAAAALAGVFRRIRPAE